MLYPEFHCRPPPPTYLASMQEYRFRLLLLDKSAPAVTLPPTYRLNSASLIRRMTGAWCRSESYRAPRAEPTVTTDVPNQIDLKYAEDTIGIPKTEQERDPDEHLVTIVHTDAQPVIVTVRLSRFETRITHTSKIDILANL